MRYLFCLLVVLVSTTMSSAAENVFYVKCRIWNPIPSIGILHHACILICEDGVAPFVKDAKGRNVSNPACEYYGSRPPKKGFHLEGHLVDIRVVKVNASPELVRQHLDEYSGRWMLWRNCQTVAKWAISEADSTKTVRNFLFKKEPR